MSSKGLLHWMGAAARDVLLRRRLAKYNFFSGTVGWDDCVLVLRALASGEPLGDGPAVRRFEEAFAARCGARHAVSFAAGRMALYALLEAMDVGPGDEVVVPAYNCVVVPNAVIYRGARPVYVDIDPETYGLDPRKLAAALTPRTKAVVAQHSFGLPCRIEEIVEVAGSRGVPVVEDCAHALGAERAGRKLGTFGRAAFYSTDATKVISTGLGGMVATDDGPLAERLRALQERTPFLPAPLARRLAAQAVAQFFLTHPRVYFVGKYLQMLLTKARLLFYFKDEGCTVKPSGYPYPARLGHVQALLGLNQLAKLDENIAHRRAKAAEYRAVLEPRFPGHLPVSPGDGPAYLRYPVLAEDVRAWDAAIERTIEPGDWFRTVTHGRDEDFEQVGYVPGSCPVGEAVSARSLNFPTHFRAPSASLLARILEEHPELRLIRPAAARQEARAT